VQQLKTAIKIFLRKSGLEKGVKQNTALLLWDEVVGKNIAENTNPEKVEHGTLLVTVENSSWRQELVFKKKEIIDKLNNKIGKKTIKDIRFI
jgi:predicted nucleic acid-binding Zn ribbon protein